MRFRTSVARRAVGWWAELPVASDHDESPIRLVEPSPVQLDWLQLGAVVLLLSAIEDPEALPELPHASAVTLAELSVGPLVARTDAERAARQAVLQQFEADFDPLTFDDLAARALGRVAASLRTAGLEARVRSYAAMFAAIAIAQGLPLYTANPDDYRGIDGLEVRVAEVGAGG